MPSHRKNHEMQASNPDGGITPRRAPAYLMGEGCNGGNGGNGGNGKKGGKCVGGSDGQIRGAALVIVLCFLVIITGLVVAFLSSITNEATATAASAAGVTTRSLADAAIQLDIAQIRDATAGFAHASDGSLNTASPVAWASQPGAIRTFDTNASSGGGGGGGGVSVGGGGTVYKLYTSTNMVDTAGGNPTNDLPAAGWVSNPALYVDLNSPVVSQGNTNYPILDPVLTNMFNGLPIVDGFSINMSAPMLSGVSNNAAMPVTWLYMLKNGTLIAPDSGGTTKATFSGPNKPTSNNPIVGRIAFWTDDETCKLNINTASEGSFWATPSFSTSADQAFAQYPPGALEFNRYPGHPASTCLSPVLWSFMGLSNPAQLVIPNPNNTNSYIIAGSVNLTNGNVENFNKPSYLSATLTNYLMNLFTNVTPRYGWGGSYGGIKTLITNSSANTNLSLPTNRLYASVDEFFFAPTNPAGATFGRTNNPVFVTNSGGGGPGIGIASSGIPNASKLVAGLRFFLTAESRAPEVNPLNLPKITLWPVPDPNYRMTVNGKSSTNAATFFDQVIATDSTLGTNAYYFTRYDASSPTNDIAAGAVKGRNQKLYDYFRRMLNQSVPGFKGSFNAPNKWTASQTDQIATEVYDYIRSCINLCDSSMATNAASLTNYSFSNSYTVPPSTGGITNMSLGSGGGQVVPIQIQNPDGGSVTAGMGRFPTLRGGTLWFTAAAANQPPLICYPDGKPKVYLTNGTEISTNSGGNSTIQMAYITNVLAGQAYAQINPLHPWTTPFTNSVSLNGIAMVPQYTNALGQAFLADTNPTGYIPSVSPPITGTAPKRMIGDPTSINLVYPIFVLSTNNGLAGMSNSGGVSTRTFPSYSSTNNGSGMLTYGTNTAGGGPGSGGVTGGGTMLWVDTNAIHKILYTNVVVSLATNGVSIATPASPVTHLGLPFVTVQNTNGAFNIPNANYYYGPNLTNTLAAFPPHTTVVQCAYLPNFVTVTPGSAGINASLSNTVSGLNNNLQINGSNMVFAGTSLTVTNFDNAQSSYLYDQGLMALMASQSAGKTNQLYTTNDVLVTNLATNTSFANYSFSFTSTAPLVNTLSSTLGSGAAVQTISINFPSARFATPKLPLWIGTINGNQSFPCDNTLANPLISSNANAPGAPTPYSFSTNNAWWSYYQFSSGIPYSNNALSFRPVGTGSSNLKLKVATGAEQEGYLFPSVMMLSLQSGDLSSSWNALNAITADTVQSVDLQTGDPRMIACLTNVPASFFTTNPLYGYSNMITVNGWSEPLRNAHSINEEAQELNGGNYGTLLFTNGVDSYWLPPVVLNITGSSTPTNRPMSGYSSSLHTNLAGVTAATNLFFYPLLEFRTSTNPTYYSSCGTIYTLSANLGFGDRPEGGPFAHKTNALFWNAFTNGGDFDTGIGYYPDGPYMGKVDEGFGSTNFLGNIGFTPYFALRGSVPGGALFSPNRMVPSPVIFGSLPVGITGNSTNILTNAWRTLQFSPNPNSPNATNPARSTVAGYNAAGKTVTNPVLADHLLLDFFQMPVVQPYPISDPFSTAGKVNMNYQIVPFTHISRDSAMRGVLKPVMITAVDAKWGYDYKLRSIFSYSDNTSQRYNDSTIRLNNLIAYNSTNNTFEYNTGQWYFHYPIHLSNTLAQFTARFTSTPGGDLFRSPSEICALWLYPAQQPTTNNLLANTNPATNSAGTQIVWDANNANITSWWYGTSTSDMNAKSLTGDNIRERPYNYLYPRLTTKSNTYQIHYRVQTLKQTSTAHPSDWGSWIDPVAGGITDKMIGESRGSAVIERFIDPSDTTLPDFTTFVSSGGGGGGVTVSSTNTMDAYYKFRVFNAKQFTP